MLDHGGSFEKLHFKDGFRFIYKQGYKLVV